MVIDSSANKLLQISKNGQRLLDNFWKIWGDEYLSSLRERYQTVLKKKEDQAKFNPCVGYVVLIKDDTPGGGWRLGKITEQG